MKNRIQERGAAYICQTGKGSLEKEGFLLYDKKRFLWAAGLFRAESGRLAQKSRKRRKHMTCQEAERLVTPYIRDELSGDELEAFLNHIDECPNCREELEIYFMVDVGLRQLDNGSGTYDIAGDLERKIEDSYLKVSHMWMFRIFRYAVNTLGAMAMAVMVLLQFRIWFF